MVKKKSAENKSTIIEPQVPRIGINDGVEVKTSQPNPAEQLLKILQPLADKQVKTDQRLDSLTKAITNIAQAMDAKAEAQPKNTVMDGIKMIVDLLNNPVVQKITDKVLGSLTGGEEATEGTVPQPSQEEIKKYQELAAYRDGRMKRMDEMQESWMSEMVNGLKLANSMKKREMEAEF